MPETKSGLPSPKFQSESLAVARVFSVANTNSRVTVNLGESGETKVANTSSTPRGGARAVAKVSHNGKASWVDPSSRAVAGSPAAKTNRSDRWKRRHLSGSTLKWQKKQRRSETGDCVSCM